MKYLNKIRLAVSILVFAVALELLPCNDEYDEFSYSFWNSAQKAGLTK